MVVSTTTLAGWVVVVVGKTASVRCVLERRGAVR
jgi:hypothetical protein